ncbi:hypothetical protein E1H99_12355 [Enterococcus hirae]|nr:hypothetical protein [Enterococcus sp. 10A9_DIV0425]THE07656.1 hypothetical protein E1H99_12355 [Enterococcus hirae]
MLQESKEKLFKGFITAVTLASFIVPSISSTVIAEEQKPLSEDEKIALAADSYVLQQSTNSEYLSALDESNNLTVQFAEADLQETNFDEAKMSTEQKEAYNEIVYHYATQEALRTGSIGDIDKLANQMKMVLNAENEYIQTRLFSISVGIVAGAFNILIAAGVSILTGGAGTSIVAAVKKKGLTVVKNWIKNTLLGQLKNKLVALGLSGAAAYLVTSIADSITSLLDPGLWIAKFIDSKDKKKNNGYIDV